MPGSRRWSSLRSFGLASRRSKRWTPRSEVAEDSEAPVREKSSFPSDGGSSEEDLVRDGGGGGDGRRGERERRREVEERQRRARAEGGRAREAGRAGQGWRARE